MCFLLHILSGGFQSFQNRCFSVLLDRIDHFYLSEMNRRLLQTIFPIIVEGKRLIQNAIHSSENWGKAENASNNGDLRRVLNLHSSYVLFTLTNYLKYFRCRIKVIYSVLEPLMWRKTSIFLSLQVSKIIWYCCRSTENCDYIP